MRFLQSAGVLLLISALYLPFLWDSSVPLTGDQKTYLSIAVEMRSRSEWVVPYLFDQPNFLKPPFQYWATLLGWKIFGFNVFGALLPSVLALLGSAALVRALSPDRSWVRALFFSGILSVMTYGTTAQMEIWILLFYLLCWYLLMQGRWGLAWVSAGVMAWIKGPLYPVLWAASVGLQKIMQERRRFRLSWRHGLWMGAGAGVGLLWYALAARTHYREMMEVFLLRENVGKLSTRQGTPWGLWGEFLGTLFPMLPWWLGSLAGGGLREIAPKQRAFWISYALVPALFFTLFPYRVNTYLFILVPVAVWSMSVKPLPLGSRGKSVLFAGVALTAGLLLVVLGRLYQGDWLSNTLFCGFVVAIGVWIHGHVRLNAGVAGMGALLLVTCVRLLALDIGERDLKPLRAAHAANASGGVAYLLQGEDIWHEFGQVSAALGAPVALLRNPGDREAFLAQGGLLILNDEQADQGAGLHCEEWSRMKRRLKFPLRDLLLKGLSFQDPSLRRVFHLCRAPGP